MIVCGGSTKGRVARKRARQRSRRADPARAAPRARHHPVVEEGDAVATASATSPACSPRSRSTPRQGDRGEGRAAQARGRRARPDRARARRDHRHRHLRDHRRGDHDLRAVDHPLLHPRRRDVHVLRAGVRGAGVLDPGLGQRLHLLLRHARRARGVDHRLGPDPRVRRCRSPPSRSAGAPTSTSCSTRCSASRCRTSIATRPARRAARSTSRRRSSCSPITAVLMHRRARVRAHQHDHGVLQARGAAAVPRARRHRVHGGQLLAVLRRGRGLRRHRDGGHADLLRLHRLRRRLDLQRGGRGARDATCRSRSSARW